MKTTAIMNLKGGVAKTITAVNMASILAEKHGKRVLLVDADHQGNTSSFFPAEAADSTLLEVLVGESETLWSDSISPSGMEGLDVLCADMRLAKLDLPENVSEEEKARRLTRLRDFLEAAAEDDAYDHCIIDMPPSFSTAAQAALIAADEVIIPMKIDAFSMFGLVELMSQIDSMRKVNPRLKLRGALVTMYRNAQNTNDAVEFLHKSRIPVFGQVIRWTDRLVDESTFAHKPLTIHSPRSAAARDYCKFVEEYLGGDGNGR